MTTEQLLNQTTAAGDVAAYGAVMAELTGWTCQPGYSHLEGPCLLYTSDAADE